MLTDEIRSHHFVLCYIRFRDDLLILFGTDEEVGVEFGFCCTEFLRRFIEAGQAAGYVIEKDGPFEHHTINYLDLCFYREPAANELFVADLREALWAEGHPWRRLRS